VEDLKSKLLTQEMSRKDFLKFLGAGALVVFGVSNFIKMLKDLQKSPTASKETRSGFGSSKFGV
jgi:hypothetical protein